MSDWVDEFEAALKKFEIRWRQEKGSVIALQSRIDSLRAELSNMSKAVDEKKDQLLNLTKEIPRRELECSVREKQLEMEKKRFESEKAESLEALKVAHLMVEDQRGELETKRRDLVAELEKLKKKEQAMKDLIG